MTNRQKNSLNFVHFASKKDIFEMCHCKALRPDVEIILATFRRYYGIFF